MLRAFSTAATGMHAQETKVNVIANNLANINTSGFKKSQLDFQDLMYLHVTSPASETDAGTQTPTGLEVGNGVRVASSLKVFTQGELENTGRPLDMAIQGDGFFKVATPNGDRYTRDGAFRVDANGDLVTASGYRLEPGITIPADWKTISIGANGTVSVVSGTSSEAQQVGKISLVRFPNSSGLNSEGDNLYSWSAAAGSAVEADPMTSGLGSIRQGMRERSNVQMVDELVNMIMAQRAYEINSRAIKAGDEMLTTANQLMR